MAVGIPVLEVAGLVKAYGSQRALDGVDLTVGEGEIVGLLGPNGAGKSTLISIVSGLLSADAGSVRIGGIDALEHPHRARSLLGLAPQETGVYPTLTCRQNLQFLGELSGLRRRQLRRAIGEVAEGLGLSHLLERRAQHLSGGERRRLHTAMALIHRPPLVILDEPTTGADVRTRVQLLQLVECVAALGSAVVYSTHYLTEIEQLAASVLILDRGRTIATGSVHDLVAEHGPGVIEMTFNGPAPPVPVVPPGTALDVEGSVIRVRTDDAGAATAALLKSLGPEAHGLRSLVVVQPSLETVFLELTGRRYDPSASRSQHVA